MWYYLYSGPHSWVFCSWMYFFNADGERDVLIKNLSVCMRYMEKNLKTRSNSSTIRIFSGGAECFGAQLTCVCDSWQLFSRCSPYSRAGGFAHWGLLQEQSALWRRRIEERRDRIKKERPLLPLLNSRRLAALSGGEGRPCGSWMSGRRGVGGIGPRFKNPILAHLCVSECEVTAVCWCSDNTESTVGEARLFPSSIRYTVWIRSCTLWDTSHVFQTPDRIQMCPFH